MPLGNGELGINLWVEENGDLLFYLGRNDTHSEVGQLCKAGWVSVSLSPNPFAKGAPFRQELKIRDGVCEITAGPTSSAIRLKVFVDAAQPVVHVVGESAARVTVTAKILSWRERPQKPTGRAGIMALGGSPEPVIQAADTFRRGGMVSSQRKLVGLRMEHQAASPGADPRYSARPAAASHLRRMDHGPGLRGERQPHPGDAGPGQNL